MPRSVSKRVLLSIEITGISIISWVDILVEGWRAIIIILSLFKIEFVDFIYRDENDAPYA